MCIGESLNDGSTSSTLTAPPESQESSPAPSIDTSEQGSFSSLPCVPSTESETTLGDQGSFKSEFLTEQGYQSPEEVTELPKSASTPRTRLAAEVLCSLQADTSGQEAGESLSGKSASGVQEGGTGESTRIGGTPSP